MKKVTLTELTVFSGVVPLASGYMEACCRKDPVLAASFEFEKVSLPVKTPFRDVYDLLEATDADVYAFSCYVWNSGLVRRLVADLIARKPQVHVVLGGPQVMHQGARYLSADHDNVVVCNGEGERTFPNVLRALLSRARDFSTVRGLSFYRDGQLVTTEPEPRISDLSEIPSPFLEGLFENDTYTWVLIETNRGCPFKCNYCYWGAATGAKVYKYNDERIQQELTWISQSGCWYLFIADANWGMLKRDVELSRFIVSCRKQFDAPLSVYFCGSKNTPERVAEITGIFHEAGLMSCQSVALQTMSAETLKRVNRENIKTSAYIHTQQALNARGIPSFVEIIWPLPGETLASFQEGLATLCGIGADSFVIYPLLLMNNVELGDKREEFGLVTVLDPDPNSEAEIVVQTGEVGRQDYEEGLRFMYAVVSLYCLRGLACLGRYLHRAGIMSYGELFRRFVSFARQRPDHPYDAFCERSIRTLDSVTFSNIGALVHVILHAERNAFDELMRDFVRAQEFWGDPLAEFLFEVDLINRPYIYRDTPIHPKPHDFRQLHVAGILADGYSVEIPPRYLSHLREYQDVGAGDPSSKRFRVNHRRTQLPHMRNKPAQENYLYCQDTTQRMGNLMPVWREAEPILAGV